MVMEYGYGSMSVKVGYDWRGKGEPGKGEPERWGAAQAQIPATFHRQNLEGVGWKQV